VLFFDSSEVVRENNNAGFWLSYAILGESEGTVAANLHKKPDTHESTGKINPVLTFDIVHS